MAAISSSSSDIIFQNVSLYNDSGLVGAPSAPGVETPASFSEDRSQALLDRPDEWVGSIVRFQIAAQNIPILTFSPARPYYVALEVGPSTFTQQVVYTSRSSTSTAQTVFTYDHMLQMINTALAACRTAAVAAGAIQLTENPYFTYDPTTYLFRYICPKAQYFPEVPMTGVIGTSGCKIWLNDNLYHLFHGIDSFDAGLTGNLTTGKCQNILVYDKKNNSLDATHWFMSQQVNTLSLWNDARNIVITSASMPIVNEWIASKSVTSGTAGSGLLGRSILTDYVIGSDSEPVNSSYQIYIPTVYRFFGLQGSVPLRRLDLQAWTQTVDGSLNPITLPLGSMFQVKLMFIRKTSPVYASLLAHGYPGLKGV